LTEHYEYECLQGRVKFPTGGKVRERFLRMNWCNSNTDSKVWMKEDVLILLMIIHLSNILTPEEHVFSGVTYFSGGFYL
jgi:hypothetical protein